MEQFLDNPLSYLNYSEFMQNAIIAALNTKAFPNPKVAAVLTDIKGNIKATGVHHGPGVQPARTGRERMGRLGMWVAWGH